METADRLSELPDCLLESVLSCLTSRQAARTSVLSRRWRHLWRMVPCVHIDHREFPIAEPADLEDLPSKKRRRIRRQEWVRLKDLADMLLPPPHCASPPLPELDKFGRTAETANLEDLPSEKRRRTRRQGWSRLLDHADVILPPPHCASPPPPPELDKFHLGVAWQKFDTARTWIHRGLKRRPVAFHLRCDNDTPTPIGHQARHEDKWPAFPGQLTPHLHAGAFMRRLRTLQLSGLRLSGDFADIVAAESPVLETLRLDDCRQDFSRLAAASLKELSMDHCNYGDDSKPLVLAVPSIASLRIHGYGGSAHVTSECEMPSIIAASLTCVHRAYSHGLLSSIRNTRSLRLSRFRDTDLLGDKETQDDFPVFQNLRSLLLHECNVGVDGQVLLRFLQNSPSLETLTLTNGALWGWGGDGSWSMIMQERAPSSYGRAAYECKNLKTIDLEFWGRCAVEELADTLVANIISKQVVQPIQTSVRDGKSTVKISFT